MTKNKQDGYHLFSAYESFIKSFPESLLLYLQVNIKHKTDISVSFSHNGNPTVSSDPVQVACVMDLPYNAWMPLISSLCSLKLTLYPP